MKTMILKATTLLGALLIMVTSCKKENPSGQEPSYNDELTVLVNQAGSAMDKQEVFSDDPTQTIYMLNDGISPDFLADETYLEENPQGTNADWKFIHDHSFIRCLKGLSLTDTQAVAIKKDLRAYTACTKHAVQRAKSIYQELKEKYRMKYQRLWNAFQNGSITKEEFREKVAELRAGFIKELRQLHLKEKLDEALKNCLREFFKELHGTLTERQWNAFVKCYKR